MARTVQSPLLPETIQTILKCISTPSIAIGTELSQELYLINLEARTLIDKLGVAQKLPAQNIGNQNFELIQSMMNNININNNNNNNNPNFSSPSKIFTPPIGMNQPVNLNTPASLAGKNMIKP